MAMLETNVSVGGSRVFYEVSVVDTDPNAEANAFVFNVTGDSSGLSADVLETAIQAFADSLAGSKETLQVGGIQKTKIITEAIL